MTIVLRGQCDIYFVCDKPGENEEQEVSTNMAYKAASKAVPGKFAHFGDGAGEGQMGPAHVLL